MKKWLFCVSFGAAAWAASFSSQGVQFECPLGLSTPSRAGVHCESLQYPAQAEGEQVELEILHYRTSSEEEQRLSQAGQSTQKYFVTTFLGLSGMPSQVNKIVLGGKGGRHLVYAKSIPREARVDIFERDLKDGTSYVAAISYGAHKEMPESVIAIARSLKYPE